MRAHRIFTSFHASLETRFIHSSHISIKTQVLSNESQANHFKIGILIYLKTLPKCQKRKDQKYIGFGSKMVNRSRLYINRLNRLGYRQTDSLFPIKVRSRGTKNTFSLLVAFPSQSTFGRSPVEAMVTYQSIKCSNGQ